MVKISVSQAARCLGFSRGKLQKEISLNNLHTHEGYLTMADIKLVYPDFNYHIDRDLQIQKTKKIKEDAINKMFAKDKISQQNKIFVDELVLKLQNRLKKEITKNKHYQEVLLDLSVKLDYLEHNCHKKDKQDLHILQDWLANNTKH